MVMIPWMFKFVLGMISDKYAPWRGLHRIPYIVANNLLAGTLSLLMVIPVLNLDDTITLLFFISFTGCWADVMYDALMTAAASLETPEEVGFLSCLCWSVRAAGGGVGGLLGPVMYREGGRALVFGI